MPGIKENRKFEMMDTQKEKNKAEKLSCVACDYPFGRVQIGKGLVITSRHDSHIHTNVLTPAQLRELANKIEQGQA